MNVLFVGTSNIAASYLADRLYREGNSISWVTSEKKENLWSREFKGHLYRIGYDVPSLVRILNLRSADTVIFTGVGPENEERKNESQIPALQNILKAVCTVKLVHFVFLSSAELASGRIAVSLLAELSYGEAMCMAYHEGNGIPVLIARMGMVYGNYPLEQMGYPGETLKKITDGETIECPYPEDGCVDLIYGEDAAVAVNNLLETGCQGLYHIVTGHPVEIKEFHVCLEQVAGKSAKVSYTNRRRLPEKSQYRELSRRVKEDTGWIPFYLLREKGTGILALALDRYNIKKSESARDVERSHKIREFSRRFPNVRAVLEALALFVLMLWVLPFTQGSTDLRYVDVRLLYIALVAVMFGMRTGLFATVLACLSYAASLSREGIDLTFLLYSVETWIPFIIYGIAGSMLGYMSDHKNDAIEESEEKYANLYERYTFLKGLHKEALEVKGKLQQQISASKESFGKMYEVAEQLNTLDPELVFFHAVDVMSETIGHCGAAIWQVNQDKGSFARRKACTAGLRDLLPNSLDMRELPHLLREFSQGGLFVNRELDENYPDYAAPVYLGDRMVAFIAVYQLEAEKFTLYYQNLFKVLAGLTENSLLRAMEYETRRRDERYLPGTQLLNAAELSRYLDMMEEEKEKGYLTFLCLRLKNQEAYTPAELSGILDRLVRDNDFFGVDEDGEVQIVLVNAEASDFPVISRRFAGRGMEVVL